jgi:hypothetical protein
MLSILSLTMYFYNKYIGGASAWSLLLSTKNKVEKPEFSASTMPW